MRIGTWNVECAPDNRLDVLRHVIAANYADIWILTETHDSLVPFQRANGVHSGPRPRQRVGSRWVSIWSRFPILEQIPCNDVRRTVCALIEIAPDRRLAVYGTVMPWGDDQGDDPPQAKIANFVEHDRVVPLQCAEWLQLQKQNPQASLCVAGDLNTDMGSAAWNRGTKRSIGALLQGMSKCGLFCATAPGRVPDWRLPLLPIDHILLPVEWAGSASVVAAWPAMKGAISDHSGLVVEVEMD
jgi:hypothetical protein